MELKINAKCVIAVFANFDYLPVLQNWIEGMRRLEIDNFLVIAIDRPLFDYLQKENINAIYRPVEPGLGKLWIHRIHVLRELIAQDYDVMHSDADAVWLKDPMETYFEETPYDMLFSQGTYWPPDVHEKWGFVLCCGLFYLRSNPKTKAFLAQMAVSVEQTQDDQISCNRLLEATGIRWEVPAPYELAFQGRPFTCSDRLITGSIDGLSMAVLPHRKFQRVLQDADDIYVRHIVCDKKADSKINELKQCGCYLLPDEEAVPKGFLKQRWHQLKKGFK